MRVMLYPCMFCVALSMFGETIRNMFRGIFILFLLNVMDLLSVVGGAQLD